MKTKLLFIFLIVSMKCFSQTIVNKTDEFTGQKLQSAVVFFGKKILGAPILGLSTPSLTFSKVNEVVTMSFVFPGFNTQLDPNAHEEIKARNCSILLKMENDSIVRFKPDTTISTVMHNGLTYTVVVGSKLSDSQLSYLMYNKIKIFRMAVMGDNGADIELMTDRNKREIQKACMYMLGMQEVEDKTEN